MVEVNFYIDDKIMLTDTFDEQPLIRADYVFDGMKHRVGSVNTNDDGSFNYYLLYDDRSFYEANAYHIPINDGFDRLAQYGIIKGFL